MEDKITLTKVSDSRVKLSESNIAVYKASNGTTLTFVYKKNNSIPCTSDEAEERKKKGYEYIEDTVNLTHTN